MTVCVIGAGMAGLACAMALRDAGRDVVVLDKGRGPGGRMATRRLATELGEVSFDHGAQYLTARDPGFQSQVSLWAGQGLMAPWLAAGEGAWVGIPSMSAPMKAMGQALDVKCNVRADKLAHSSAGWMVRSECGQSHETQTLVLAIPAEQAAGLLMPVAPDLATRAQRVPSRPCWTVMLAFSQPLPYARDTVGGDDDQPLGWAARNSAKPGRGAIETWVVQAGADWSEQHLEHSPGFVESALMDALAIRLELTLPQPIACSSHRWRYARSGHLGSQPLWEQALGLGVCGDWLLGPRIEDAWLSGNRLAGMILSD